MEAHCQRSHLAQTSIRPCIPYGKITKPEKVTRCSLTTTRSEKTPSVHGERRIRREGKLFKTRTSDGNAFVRQSEKTATECITTQVDLTNV